MDWTPPYRLTEETPAYIAYSVNKCGAMKSVTITRVTTANHYRAQTGTYNYTKSEVMRDVLPEVAIASVEVRNAVQNVRLKSAQGHDIGVIDNDSDHVRKYQFIEKKI
ncbi:hypothetical protein NPIL_364621 [Nephila pilipes]|uniref:Uncharacterized protein n=1 Tax=Nephila pilipes TaxID=299642 RepID=A0A8X6PIG1_NEPPI|nr:hypothetical protein NPIL_364621 [Nephila pilipes]